MMLSTARRTALIMETANPHLYLPEPVFVISSVEIVVLIAVCLYVRGRFLLLPFPPFRMQICSPLHVTACYGPCAPAAWIADGICDIRLNCTEHSFDGGDCLRAGSGNAEAICPEELPGCLPSLNRCESCHSSCGQFCQVGTHSPPLPFPINTANWPMPWVMRIRGHISAFFLKKKEFANFKFSFADRLGGKKNKA